MSSFDTFHNLVARYAQIRVLEDSQRNFKGSFPITPIYRQPMRGNKRRIRQYYDQLSGTYDELYGREQYWKHEKILEFLWNRNLGITIDVGCGTGELLDRISTKSSMAVGIDLSGQMLRKAREKLKKSGAELVMADASAIPLRGRVADCVIAVSILESRRPEQVLELTRTAKAGATIVMTVFHDQKSPDVGPDIQWPDLQELLVSKKETIYVGQVPSDSLGRGPRQPG